MELADLWLVVPELVVLALACAVLLVDGYLHPDRRQAIYWLSQVALAAGAVSLLLLWPAQPVEGFGGTYVSDALAQTLKLSVLLITSVVLVYSRSYLRARGIEQGEYYVLALLGALGMMILASGKSFLVLYLGLELLALSQYAMVAFRRDSAVGSEAAMKYFVLGALASGMLLYGFSLLYGLTGTLDLAPLAAAIAGGAVDPLGVTFALAFVVVGIGFKLGAAPFHMWLPDVYQGAPTAVTLYLSAAPKIAAFALMARLLGEGLWQVSANWEQMLAILAAVSLVLGNLVAIAQTSIKRMLAYSTISHMGFLLLGMVAASPEGLGAAMFYSLIYALLSAGAFGVLLLLDRAGEEVEHLNEFKGLAERSPWYAMLMLLLMFGMAGIPPTAGFYAKLVVLQALVADGQWIWLAVLAVLTSVIGAFYYLRIIKLMYFESPDRSEPLAINGQMGAVLSVNGLAIIGLGLLPGPLLLLCIEAARTLPLLSGT